MIGTVDLHSLLPAASSILCWIFAGMLLNQWRQRRKPYQLIWAIGLVFYALASAADASGRLSGWSATSYRVWYFFGAVGVAAWLGMGEIFLFRTGAFGELVALCMFGGAIPAMIRGGKLMDAHNDVASHAAITLGLCGIGAAVLLAVIAWEKPEWLGRATFAAVAVGTVIAGVQVLAAPVDLSQIVDPATGVPTGNAMPDLVRLMTPLFNISGAGAMFMGAVYSAWTFWRKRASGERVVSNVLIALGSFAPSLTSSLNRFGFTEVFYWGELLGVLLIFAGFLASSEVFTRRFRALVPARVSLALAGRSGQSRGTVESLA